MTGPVTDVHVHIQPREMIKPEVMEAFRKGCKDSDAAEPCFVDAGALLAYMDAAGVERLTRALDIAPIEFVELDLGAAKLVGRRAAGEGAWAGIPVPTF